MLSLLLLYAITQSHFGDAVPISSMETRDPSVCGELIQTRTLWNIVWSCLSTIFLCTWGSLHPNISSTPDEPGMSRRDKLRKWVVELLTCKLPLFLWALLVPEYILAWAIRQYMTAGEIQKRGGFLSFTTETTSLPIPVPGWTRTHGFFLIMGGFQLYQQPQEELLKQEEGGVVSYSINPGEFVRILEIEDVRQHQLATIIPRTTEGDLKDRGKSDGISKAIVLLQTSWFIVQCIARFISHLPLTELEIITLAYAMMNSFIYIFWWDKPRDVGCPIRVYETITTNYTANEKWRSGFLGIVQRIGAYVLGFQDRYVLLSKQRKVPIFWSSRCSFEYEKATGGALLGPSVLGIAFGAIHFIAWWYGFPSYAEFMLWRISCVALVAVPLFSTIACGWLATQPDSGLLDVIFVIAILLLMLSAWLYVVARVATIVIAFTALRSLPSDALLELDWTTFIPHI
jgi:hypothetical protein